MFIQKIHRFPRRTAAERKNIRRAAAAHHATGLPADFLFQKTDAIAHRAAGRVVEQVSVDEPGVKRLALETVAHNHAHHFVVAGVAQRLGVSAVKKRRAQKIRMQLPPAKRAVRRPQFLGDGVGHRFKTLKETGQRGQHRRAQIGGEVGFQFRAFGGGGGTQVQFHAFEPLAQVVQEGLEIGHGHFVIRRDEIGFLPGVKKAFEILNQIAFGDFWCGGGRRFNLGRVQKPTAIGGVVNVEKAAHVQIILPSNHISAAWP